jgi:riboflavin kinase / FMN adenylyltransferase
VSGSCVAIGMFDGVHLGHCRMLDAATEAAARIERSSGDRPSVVAVTFDPHPQAVVGAGAPQLICTLGERIRLLHASGVDRVEVIPFTEDVSRLSPELFHERWIRERLHARSVAVGDNFRFGHRAAGTTELLGTLNEAAGIETVIVPLFTDGGEPVSSSRIRDLVHRDGDVEAANRILGRAFSLSGPVVTGARRGRTLGMPTANLAVDPALLMPADGVYGGHATFDGRTWLTAISIGTNPQFTGPAGIPVRTVEAHLLDYEGPDFYGADLRITFEQRVRGQETFGSVDELVDQMHADLESVRGALRV